MMSRADTAWAASAEKAFESIGETDPIKEK